MMAAQESESMKIFKKKKKMQVKGNPYHDREHF